VDEINPFVRDFTNKYVGIGSVVLTPTTTEQISECLKYCNERLLAVVPQGGNTGLVGGSVPLHDEVVISTKKMNQIFGFDETQGTLTCEAGAILETLQNYT
jgi:FAD/FMN-containing dehydrogenase